MHSPGPVPPHSVMPETLALRSGGYLLTGGRSGLYLWHCADTACVDGGGWQSYNLARHHNEMAASRESAPPMMMMMMMIHGHDGHHPRLSQPSDVCCALR